MPYFGLLETIAIAANEAESTHDALRRALHAICTMTGWSLGHVFVRRDDDRLVSSGLVHLALQLSEVRLADFRRLSAEIACSTDDLPGRAMAERKPVWQAPLEARADLPRLDAARQAGFAALYAFPVLAGGEAVAVFEFANVAPQVPDDRLLLLMHHVGLQLGHVFARELNRQRIAASEQRQRRILDAAADAFIGMNVEGNITAWNAAAERVFGWTREEALGQMVDALIVPERYRHAHRTGLQRFLDTGEAQMLGRSLCLPALHRNGRELFVEITMWALQEQSVEFYAFARDVTERHRVAEELARRAHYDTLTALPNRGLMFERLQELLATRGDAHLALLFIDLDHFKRVNDTLGHRAGDQVLLSVAQRIVGVVRPNDMVARLAGDEFVVLCPGVDDFHQATQVARRINDALTQPILVDGDSLFITASIGVSMADQDSDAETLLTAADTAMYEAKHCGRGHYQLFDERMALNASSRLNFERELRAALSHEQLQLNFQPVFTCSGQIESVEALLRWHHPTRGMLMPDEFLPVAETSGLIVAIDDWALATACRHAVQWLDGRDVSQLRLVLNLSERRLAHADLVASVRQALASMPAPGRGQRHDGRIQLGFDVTEAVLMRDPEAAAATLQALKALGVWLTIDNFGNGPSSIACLRRFPVDALKLSPHLIRDVASNPRDQAIVRSIVGLAADLGLEVIATGVEHEAQADVLCGLGITCMQGYLFALPQPGAAFRHWLLTHQNHYPSGAARHFS